MPSAPQFRGAGRVLAGVGVGPHPQTPYLIRPAQQGFQFGGRGRLHQLHLPDKDPTGGAVDSDRIPLPYPQPTRRGEESLIGIDGNLCGAGYRRSSHGAGHHRRMAGLSAVAGQDPFGGEQRLYIVGSGLPSNQYHRCPFTGHLHRPVDIEYRLPPPPLPERRPARRKPAGEISPH